MSSLGKDSKLKSKSELDDFQFRNSETWIKYSHERYLSLDDIRHRLSLRGEAWEQVRVKFADTRKMQSIPFFFQSLKKVFCYFEADCIREKISKVELEGRRIFDSIHSARTFEKEFILNASIEEAVTSAIYEGANSTRAKAKQLIAENKEPRNKDEYMLLNNYLAMQWIKEHKSDELNLDLLLRIHEIVTRRTFSEDLINYSGKFRDDVVYVGKHEGVDFKLIEPLLTEAIANTTKNPRYIHPLLKGILLHYFIAYIHPFFDGNGRTARAIFYFNALKHNLNFVELLSISAHLKDHGDRYERSFENAAKYEGDITYFVDFSLDSILTALKTVEQKVALLQSIRKMKEAYDFSDHQVTLLQRLALNKFRKISIEEFSKDIHRTHEMARIELKSLAAHGFLVEVKEGKKFFYSVES